MADDTYEKALEQDARDLVGAAKAGELRPVYFRDTEIEAVLEQLERRRSVLLVGAAGVGKTAVLHGVAQALGGRAGMFEISTALLLAGTRYIGEWQTKVTRIAGAAAKAGAVLYITDIGNLAQVGRTASSNSSMLDALRPFLESGRLLLVAEATPETLRSMQRVPGFLRLFHPIELSPLADEQVDRALEAAAAHAGAQLDEASRTCLVKLTTRFVAARPQPGPALTLLAQVLDYQAQKRGIGEFEPITASFIERVFSIGYGLPPFVVSREITMSASDVRAWFAERIVGQTDAINAVVEMIALFKAGLHDPSKPIGTFLFVGPTGVGKTELARALATFIFGSPQRLLRFDLSEFKDYSSFELLLGSGQDPSKPARLLDAVRAHPFQVVLLDELEKAHSNVWDMLLPLLDEGRLTAPGGDTVDFRSTVLIATSNVGAREAAVPDKSLGFGATPPGTDLEQRDRRMRAALEEWFRPEFLNRFQHIILFHALSKEQMRRIARQEMVRVLTREGISGRNLIVDVDDQAIDLVIDEGIDVRFGARALKREVQRRLVLPLAMTLMEREVVPGSILKVAARDGELRVRVVDTEASLAQRKELEPLRAPDGRALTRDDIEAQIAAVAQRTEAIATVLLETELLAERERLTTERNAPGFWKDIALADLVQSALERVTITLERIARLREQAQAARTALAKAAARTQLEETAHRVRALGETAIEAERELCRMGWDGSPDAIVEIRPLGAGGRDARDLLLEVYTSWAKYERRAIEWLREPHEDDEAALIAIQGRYAFGLLRGESGLHRVRLPAPDGGRESVGRVSVASVRVAAWTDLRSPPTKVRPRPLKATGQHGGKIRSRIECDLAPKLSGAPTSLVLQNARTIAQNTELAAEVAESWAHARPAPEEVVRRYDRSPPLVKDALAGLSSGRPDALSPKSFDALLKSRVDAGATARSDDADPSP